MTIKATKRVTVYLTPSDEIQLDALRSITGTPDSSGLFKAAMRFTLQNLNRVDPAHLATAAILS